MKSRVVIKAARPEDLPASFAADLEAYLAALRDPDPLDPLAGRALAANTIRLIRFGLLRSAALLLAAGVESRQLTRLGDLVSGGRMRTILLALHREAGGAWTPNARHVADALVAMARRWARLPETELRELGRLRRMVRLAHKGLSPRAEDRLAQFGDERAVAALFRLPERAFGQAEALLREGQALKAAKLHETALLLALLLARPLRIGDLAGLDLQRDARRDRAGRLIEFAVLIHKTRALQRITLDDVLRRRIERHVSTFRPFLEGAANGHALFPAKDGTPRRASILGRHLTRLVARQVGIVFRPHDARHLAAQMLLDADPNALPVAQQLLGHATPKVTEQIYAVRKGRAAQAEYLRLVGEVRQRGTGGARS